MKPNKIIQQEYIEETRKHYQKPRIERITLVPEEAILAFCKSTSGAGPFNPCSQPTACIDIGS